MNCYNQSECKIGSYVQKYIEKNEENITQIEMMLTEPYRNTQEIQQLVFYPK